MAQVQVVGLYHASLWQASNSSRGFCEYEDGVDLNLSEPAIILPQLLQVEPGIEVSTFKSSSTYQQPLEPTASPSGKEGLLYQYII